MPGKQQVVVTSMRNSLCIQTPPSIFKEGLISIEVGQELSMEGLAHDLVGIGYERVSNVEGRGQFSIRGGILDIYP